MATEFVQVAVLAKGLGKTINDVLKACDERGISASRGGSKLSPAQVDRITEHFEQKAAAARQAARRYREQAERAAQAAEKRGEVLETAALQPVRIVKPEVPSEVPNGCVCCGLRLAVATVKLEDSPRCEPCREHYEIEGEDHAREVARLRDHDVRLRRAFVAAWHAQADAHEKARSARRSRDGWKAVTAKVVLGHEADEDGTCQECDKLFPCPTWRTVERVNKGIARVLEQLGTLDDDELDDKLYDSDWWEYLEPGSALLASWQATASADKATGTDA